METLFTGSGLTHKQRSLVIIIIVLLGYLSLGSFILAVMLKMAFIDGLYLSVVTIETIGMSIILLACTYSPTTKY